MGKALSGVDRAEMDGEATDWSTKMISGPESDTSTREDPELPPPSEVVSATTANPALGRTLRQGKSVGEPPGERGAWLGKLPARAV